MKPSAPTNGGQESRAQESSGALDDEDDSPHTDAPGKEHDVDQGASRQSVVYLYPENVVEYHQQLRRSGLAIPDLDVTLYGMTECRLDDPDGNRLGIGQGATTGS